MLRQRSGPGAAGALGEGRSGVGCGAAGASGCPSRGTRYPRAGGLSVEGGWWTGRAGEGLQGTEEQFYLGVQDALQGEATVNRYAWSPAVRLSSAEFAFERGLGALCNGEFNSRGAEAAGLLKMFCTRKRLT